MEILLELPNDEKIFSYPQEHISEHDLKNIISSETGLTEYSLKIWNEKFKKYINLHNFNSVVDGSRILITDLANPAESEFLHFNNINAEAEAEQPPVSVENAPVFEPDSVDEVPLNLNLRTERWERGQFKIALYDFDGPLREELQDNSNMYNLTGKRAVKLSYKLQTAIRDKLQFYLQKYTSYPSYEHIADACKTLVDTFPCLRGEEHDLCGYSRWVTSMGHRFNYYRRTHITTPEIGVNAGHGKVRSGRRAVRPLKGEINFRPAFPVFSSVETLSILKEKILLERNKTYPDRELIKTLMESTFPLRRQEITETDRMKSMIDWKKQWPELSSMEQLQQEMRLLNVTDFPALLNSFLATVEETFVQLATKSRNRRLVQAAVTAAAGNGIMLQSNLVSLNLPPQIPFSKENVLLELNYLLRDKHPFLVLRGQEPEGFPLNEGHIKLHSGQYSIWIDQTEMTSDIQSFSDACWMLSAAYYTYNLKYSIHFKHCLIFLQRICGVAKSPSSKKVDTLISQLQVIHVDPNETSDAEL